MPVILRVIDVNDNAPIISINTLTPSRTSSHLDTDTTTDLPRPHVISHVASTTAPLSVVVPEHLPRGHGHLPRGSFIANIIVTDDDLGDNGRVACDVTSRDTAFQLVPRHDNEYLASQPTVNFFYSVVNNFIVINYPT